MKKEKNWPYNIFLNQNFLESVVYLEKNNKTDWSLWLCNLGVWDLDFNEFLIFFETGYNEILDSLSFELKILQAMTSLNPSHFYIHWVKGNFRYHTRMDL